VHVFNVHLGTSFFERPHQARVLLSEDVLQGRELSGPRIVVGDFNEWTRGVATKLMSGNFQSVDRRAFRLRRTYPGLLPVLHLDHFYYDKGLELDSFQLMRTRLALVASDHLPLIGEFRIAE
jgi:endonuclease/exonuclease/phosphatase family metal-dependent hydrolase